MVTIPNPGKEKLDHSHIAGGNVKWHSYCGKQFGCSLETELAKPNCYMTQQLHSCTSIQMKQLKTYFPTKTWTQIFMVALLVMAPNWTTTQMSLWVKWLNKQWCIQTMECNLAIIWNELELTHQPSWISRNYAEWRKRNPKRLDAVWFHFYIIPQMTIL